MKTRLTSVLILAAALNASALVPLSAASAPQGAVAMAYSVSSVDHQGHLVARGTTALTVLRWFGTPHQQLSSDTWVYYGYQADFQPANDQQCDKLIFTIVRGEVTDIKLVNDRGVKVIAAHGKVKSTGTIAAAK